MADDGSIRKKVTAGLLWKFGERISAQFVSLIVSILLARILSPEDYGAVALVMIFITFANVFVSNGLGLALIQKKNADNEDFSTVFFINIGISIGVYAILFFIAPLVAEFYELPVLCPALRVLGIRIIIAAINSVQQAYVSRKMLFKRFFWSTLLGTLISGVVGVWMAYHGFGVWALVFQYLTNTTIDTLVLWITVKWRPILVCSIKKGKELISYGWKLLVSALLDTGYNQLRNLLIGKFYTKEDLAYYNQGDKFPSLIVTNINASISGVLFPALSQNQESEMRVKNMTRRAVQVSSFVMWPLMIGLGVCAEPFIKLLLTEKWLPCVPYLRIFCFTYGLWPIHTANLQAINAMGRSDIFLKLEIIKKLIGIIVLVITIPFGPITIAFGLVIVGIASAIINAFPNVKILNYTYLEQIKDMLPSFALAVVMGVVVYPIGLIDIPLFLLLLLQAGVGAIVYFFLAKLFKIEVLKYLKSFVRKKGE